MRPLTLNLYLPDGSPENSIIVTTNNWAGECIKSSRLDINRIIKKCDCKVGVYFLFGYDENQKPLVYIGEAENIANRIKQHLNNNDKSWFEHVVVFTSSSNFLTKGDVKNLEAKLIKLVRGSIEYYLDNTTNGTASYLPEHMQPSVDTFLENIVLIMPILGFQGLFSSINDTNIQKNTNNIITYKEATGMLIDNKKFRIFKDSTISAKEVNSCKEHIKLMRKRLIETGAVNPDTWKFEKDFDFNSPSEAGSIVYGGSVNGWEVWKNKTGETLNQITGRRVIGKMLLNKKYECK